jgi:MFS family permease
MSRVSNRNLVGGGVRDYRLLLASRLVRGFGFGFVSVLLGIYLQARGVSSAGVGAVLGVGVLAGSAYGLPMATLSGKVGRRRVLLLIGLLMAASGIDLAIARQPLVLGAAAVTGMVGASSVDLGPFLPIEQAMLADSVPKNLRNRAFGRYSLTGGLAFTAGAFSAAWAGSPARMVVLFLVYAVIGLVTAGLAGLLTSQVEGSGRGPVLTRTSLKPLLGLAALFSVDALGGGLVIQPVIAFWLHVRFGVGTTVLGPAIAATSLVQAASFEVAGRLADRIGLVRTMVFTHLPSNVLLIVVAFSPTFWLAVALLVLRFSISQMDVPARQAYIASIVPDQERAGALASMGLVRGVAQSVGPAIAGLAIQAAALGIPFVLAGMLKIGYDVGLYLGFRNRPADHERFSSTESAPSGLTPRVPRL